MRETCARVLAAALMTGAIAFALGAPALFESSRDEAQPLTAPPSSLQRSVRVPALPAPARPRHAERLVSALSVHRSEARSAAAHATPSAGTVRTARPKPKAPTAVRPAPEPKPETRELAAATPEPTVETPSPQPAPAAEAEGTRGKPKGKGKAKAHGHLKLPPEDEAHETTAQVDPASPAAPERGDPPKDDGHGNGHGKGRDK